MRPGYWKGRIERSIHECVVRAPIFSFGPLLLMLDAELGLADYAWRCVQELSGVDGRAGGRVLLSSGLCERERPKSGAPVNTATGQRTKCLVARWSGILCICALAVFAHVCSAAEPPAAKNVLVLYSFTDRRAQDDLEILKSTTRSHVDTPVDFHVEYLGSARFGAPGYEKAVTESLASIYGGKKMDLVITVFYPALRFALDHRQELFPGTPIAFSSVALPKDLKARSWGRVSPGSPWTWIFEGTIALALRLQPDATNAAVVVGSTETDRYWGTVIHQDIRQRQPKLNVIDLAGLATDQLLKQVSALPPRTIVFFQAIPDEETQPVVGAYEIVSTIAQRFPTYCFINRCMGHGVVGGSYPDSGEQDKDAGELAARILSGERPEDIPVVRGPRALVQVDWRQLRRWNIPESALPAGAIISYRPANILERYAKIYWCCALVDPPSGGVDHWLAVATSPEPQGRSSAA